MTRNHDLEADYLTGIERAAVTPAGLGFAALTAARLNDGDRTHGEAFASRDVADLLAEACEETLDTAGWSALALTVASRSDLSDRARERLRADVHAAGVCAGMAFAALSRAMRAVAEDHS